MKQGPTRLECEVCGVIQVKNIIADEVKGNHII